MAFYLACFVIGFMFDENSMGLRPSTREIRLALVQKRLHSLLLIICTEQ